MMLLSEGEPRLTLTDRIRFPIGDNLADAVELDKVLNEQAVEVFLEDDDVVAWLNGSGNNWQCVASDYSFNYKLLTDKHNALHKDNFAINYQVLKTVGEYRIVEITHAAYEVHDQQPLRVSVQATYVYSDQSIA